MSILQCTPKWRSPWLYSLTVKGEYSSGMTGTRKLLRRHRKPDVRRGSRLISLTYLAQLPPSRQIPGRVLVNFHFLVVIPRPKTLCAHRDNILVTSAEEH